jgi:hypothetical protein
MTRLIPIIIWLYTGLLNAQEIKCPVLDADRVTLGMSYGKFCDVTEGEKLQRTQIRADKLVVFDEFLLQSPKILQRTYFFFLPEWLLDNVVPSDAKLRSIEVQYDKDFDIRAQLMDHLGAPKDLRMPDAGIFFPYDARWVCEQSSGKRLQVTLHHRRVLWELLD